MQCPECNSQNTTKAGFVWVNRQKVQRYRCGDCGRLFTPIGTNYMIEVASIPTKNYKEVIEVRVPVRFYWNEDDSFDGIEFGEFKTTLQPWEEDMLSRCLEAIKGAIG